MSYTKWFEDHAAKHKKIMQKLLSQGLKKDEIIAYFDFDNMVRKEPDFCPLYKELNAEGKTGKKCHDMESLNCYLCACPNFRFNDAGICERNNYLIKSECSIHNGDTFGHDNVIHQDCSNCSVPHHLIYVKKHYDETWKTIMKACQA